MQVQDQARKKILIIDDTENFLRVLTRWLSDSYEVFACSNSTEGIKIVVTEKPDLILLDLKMPKISGQQLLQFFQTKEIKIPVLVITSVTHKMTLNQVMDLGARGIIRKPTNRQELLQMVKSEFIEV